MTDPTLSERLKQFGTRLASLHLQADALRLIADSALISGVIETETLVEAENSSGALYDEISAFKVVLAEVEGTSPVAAGQLGPVSDALHVLLLEVTEIGTRLYSVRSNLKLSPQLQITTEQ
jgi:hypothetical protein